MNTAIKVALMSTAIAFAGVNTAYVWVDPGGYDPQIQHGQY